MVTNRTPTKPSAALRITPLALTFFRRMEELDCSCADVGADGLRPGGQCPGCQQWWNLHSRLHDLLKLKPWHWPVYEHPDAGNPYPPGSVAHARCRPDEAAIERYRALARALAEQDTR